MSQLTTEKINSPISKVINIWKILPPKYKKHFFTVITLTSIGGMLEMFGVGLIVPFAAIISNPDVINENKLLSQFNIFMGNPTHELLVIYSVSIALIFFVIKAIFLAFTNWVMAHYIYKVKAYVGYSLFKKYLYMPNLKRLNYHSSLLIRNVTAETQFLAANGLLPVLYLIAEATVFMAIGILLFLYSPINALIAAIVIFFAMFIFQLIIKKHIQLWSDRRVFHEGIRIKAIQEGIAVSKEISLLGREEFFMKKFNNANIITANTERNNLAINQVPRLWLETIGITALMLLILVSLTNSSSASDLVPILALFAAASFRLLPSANRILSSLQSLKFGDAALNTLLKELKDGSYEKKHDKESISFRSSIELKNVSFKYPGTNKEILKSVNLIIEKGDSLGIIGESGAGKSTFVDILLGLLVPSKGEILVDGINIQNGMRSWQDKIGYVPQDIYLIDDSMKNNIALGIDSEKIDNQLIDKCVHESQISNLVHSLPEGLETMLGERGDKLSGGQKQRIGIARALYSNPEILVFDEATSALDNETEKKIIQSLEKINSEKTLVVIAHRLTTIENCNKVIRINEGKIEIIK